jgi:hypothetical protein
MKSGLVLQSLSIYPSALTDPNMAPPSADAYPIPQDDRYPRKSISASRLPGPLKYSGSLDEYESFDLTAAIGREFSTLQLSEILHDDAKIRDLGIIGPDSIVMKVKSGY